MGEDIRLLRYFASLERTDLSLIIEEALRINGCHAAGSRGSDRLPVEGILHITTSKHAGNVGGHRAAIVFEITLNDRLDFFGGAVNTAARVQGLSCGNDVMVSDEVLKEMTSGAFESRDFHVVRSFEASLRGLPELVHIHRLVVAQLTADS